MRSNIGLLQAVDETDQELDSILAHLQDWLRRLKNRDRHHKVPGTETSPPREHPRDYYNDPNFWPPWAILPPGQGSTPSGGFSPPPDPNSNPYGGG
jgi:hypothetical protein